MCRSRLGSDPASERSAATWMPTSARRRTFARCQARIASSIRVSSEPPMCPQALDGDRAGLAQQIGGDQGFVGGVVGQPSQSRCTSLRHPTRARADFPASGGAGAAPICSSIWYRISRSATRSSWSAVAGVPVLRPTHDPSRVRGRPDRQHTDKLHPGAVTLTRTTSGWEIDLRAGGLSRRDNGRYYEAWMTDRPGPWCRPPRSTRDPK